MRVAIATTPTTIKADNRASFDPSRSTSRPYGRTDLPRCRDGRSCRTSLIAFDNIGSRPTREVDAAIGTHLFLLSIRRGEHVGRHS